jgi:phosphoribosylaminoimidazolecarboxamide formyltransferase/IMP cyclohydrolase
MRALISVSDKKNLVPFAKELVHKGCEILSTGGTAINLREGGVKVVEVSDYTRFPEMMDGRLKTLHPMVHGAILGKIPEHADVMESHGMTPIDLVVVNLYPFAETIARPNCDLDTAIENIDIGGPTMIRSAAKNWRRVGVVVDPRDYPEVLREMEGGNGLSERFRFILAKRAFRHTAKYDQSITIYLGPLSC